VLGFGGEGLCSAAGVTPDIHLATLGKAFGVSGAYVTGSSVLIDYLLHRARTFVFSTGTPPMVSAAAARAVDLVAGPEGSAARASLFAHIRFLSSSLAARGLLAPSSGSSQIFPILIGDEHTALRVTDLLLEHGVYAQAIRPPTVPRDTSRLRVALMATHTELHLRALLSALDICQARGLIPKSPT
jgi:8-amino-7-oxononanoate synthase